MRIRAPNQSIQLDELHNEIVKVKDKGIEVVRRLKILLSHFEKTQEYYEEWENDLNKIQEKINTASVEHKLPIAQIEEYDALTDALGDI